MFYKHLPPSEEGERFWSDYLKKSKMTMIDVDRACGLIDKYTFDIAVINLTYTNSSMLRILERRGQAIKKN